MKQYKIEIMGGKLNGTHRYYETRKGAKIAAQKIANDKSDMIFVDIYWIDIKNKKKYLIDLIIK